MSQNANTVEFAPEPLVGSSRARDLLLLIVLSTVLAFWGLGDALTLSDHEAIVAQTARQILQGDGWLLPMENGQPRIRKPPLAPWNVAVAALASDTSDQAQPVTEFAARLPSAIACVLTVLIVYGLGRSMFSHQTGVLAGAIMAFSVAGFYFAHNAQIEMTLVLFCTAAFACFWLATEAGRSRYMLGFYAALGLSMMAKAPLPAAVVCLPLFIWWFVTIPFVAKTRSLADQWRSLPKLLPLSGIALALLICIPWPLYVYLTVNNALDLWRIEFLGRMGGELGESGGPWYYIPIAFLYLFPFCLSLPEAVASPFLRAYADKRKPLLFLLTWFVVGTVFISISPFKRPHYLATGVPALALLLAPTLEYLFLSARNMSRAALTAALRVAWVLIPLVAIGGGFLVHRDAPSILNSYVVLGSLFTVGMLTAVYLFGTSRRMPSLCILILTAMASYMWSYDTLARSSLWEAESREMVAKFRQHGIGADDRITWVVGRPNATVAFYLGREIPRLFGPMELAPLRGSRKEISEKLLEMGAREVNKRLSSDQAEYFVLKRKYWKRLRHEADAPAREVFHVSAKEDADPEDDWVIFTNDWNTRG